MSHPQLHITCDDPKVDLRVDMGDGPATITAGHAGWETVPRVRRKAMTAYAGVQPLQQDVPVLLDGSRENRSVQRQLDQILSLGEKVIFKAFGPIHNEGDLYIFGDEPEFGETIRAEDGTLVRQALTLKLMEYVPADQAGKREGLRVAVGQAEALSYTTVQGDTLAKVAFKIYHDWRRWKEIGDKNGLSDAHKVLKAGRELKL